jgi:hypothetical protein
VSDLSPESRALFQRARRDLTPRQADRVRIEQALAARIGAAAGAATIAAGAASTAAGGAGKGALAFSTVLATVKWVTLVALAGGIGLAASRLWGSGHAAPPGAGAVAGMVGSARAPDAWGALGIETPAPTATTPGATAAPVASAEAPEPPPTPAAPPALPPPAHPSSRLPAPPAGKGSVAEEVKLLRDANAALQGGDAAGALALLDEHRREHPRGALSEESAAERVFVLCRMGRVADARQEADRFLRAHPKSPLAKGIRASCAAAPGGGHASP